MKILLIGGTGLLSSEVCDLSLKKGYDVYLLNRGKKNTIVPLGVTLLKADINDRKKVEELIEDNFFDVVVDFICYNKKQMEYSFSIFRNYCFQYFFISSCAVYKKEKDGVIYTEESPQITPLWKYSVEKAESEKLLMSLCENERVNYTIVRPAVTYGDSRIPYGVMPSYGYHWTLIARILSHKPIPIWKDGKTFTTITHVRDFAWAMVNLFGNPLAYNEIFHIAGEERYQWKDVLNELGRLLEVPPEIINIPQKDWIKEIPEKSEEILWARSLDLIIDNSKIKRVLPEFKSTISLEEGLKMSLKYYEENKYLNGIDYAFDARWDKLLTNRLKKERKNPKKMNLFYIDYLKEKKLYNFFIYHLYKINSRLAKQIISVIDKLK